MAKNKIHLGNIDGPYREPLLVEGPAADAFVPGTLLERSGNNLATSNNAATVDSERLIAIEIPESEGGVITTAYTVGETAEAMVLRSGEFANVRVASSQTVVKGSPIISNGDGTFAVGTTALTNDILAYADEAVTTTAVTLVRVRGA